MLTGLAHSLCEFRAVAMRAKDKTFVAFAPDKREMSLPRSALSKQLTTRASPK